MKRATFHFFFAISLKRSFFSVSIFFKRTRIHFSGICGSFISAGGSSMAEIKSAIELAMEKTKDLHLSREEMKKLKEEEMKSKAHSLVNRFLEVDFHLKEGEKELLKFTPAERKQLEKLIRQYLSEAIQLDRDNDLIFQGIETFWEESKTLNRQIQQVIKKYREQKERAYEETEKNLLANWQKQGISGSAVQGKVEGSPDWEKALSRFKPAFEEQLRVLQEELKKQ